MEVTIRFDYHQIDTKEKLKEALLEYFSKAPHQSIENDNCKYRLNDKADCEITCAAGAFIPDALYSTNLEGKLITSLPPSAIIDEDFNVWLGQFKETLRNAQSLHDNTYNWSTTGFNRIDLVKAL